MTKKANTHGGARVGAGRQKLPNAKTARGAFRCTPAQLAEMKASAAAAGQNLSDFIVARCASKSPAKH